LRFQDHGHPIMYRLQELVSVRRENYAGFDNVTIRRFPALPKTGEGKRLAVGQAEQIGLLFPFGFDG